MSRHEEMCPHCRAKAGLDAPTQIATPVEPITLPDVPTPIRVHSEGLPPFDCTLHPDGTLTAVVGGEPRRNWMSFADMCERNWSSAHIEVDPAPLVEEPDPGPAVEAVQEALIT